MYPSRSAIDMAYALRGETVILAEIDRSTRRALDVPGCAEDQRPELADRCTLHRVCRRRHAREERALEAHLVLQASILAIGVCDACREPRRYESELAREGEERDVARVARQWRVRGAVQ